MKNEQAKTQNALDAIPTHTQPHLSGNQIHNRQQPPRLTRHALYPMLECMTQRGELDSVAVGYMRHYRRRLGHGAIAPDCGGGYNDRQRNEVSLSKEVDGLTQAMQPLKRGRTVNLWMELPVKSGKKQATLARPRLVIICPGILLGLSYKAIAVSVIGKGSCVIRPFTGEGLADLVLAGMPAKLANELMKSIHRVLKG